MSPDYIRDITDVNSVLGLLYHVVVSNIAYDQNSATTHKQNSHQ
jgi:hypothetical protein